LLDSGGKLEIENSKQETTKAGFFGLASYTVVNGILQEELA